MTKCALQINIFYPVLLCTGTVSRIEHLNIAHKFSAEEIKIQHYCLEGSHVISPLEYGICSYRLNFAEGLSSVPQCHELFAIAEQSMPLHSVEQHHTEKCPTFWEEINLAKPIIFD